MMKHKTSHLSLSTKRVTKFIEEARATFVASAVGRLALKEAPPQSSNGFRRIGISHIVDRIWFVEGLFEGEVFAPPSGAPYGDAIAEGEDKLILRNLLDYGKEHRECLLELSSDPTESDFFRLLEDFRKKDAKATAIIANIPQSLRFWEFKQFTPGDIRRGLTSPEGYFVGVPVYHSRLIPAGLTLAVNGEELGILEVKSDFAISVSDFDTVEERESIRQQLPELSDEDLMEKVGVNCGVVVKPTIQDGSALRWIVSKGSQLEIRVPTE